MKKIAEYVKEGNKEKQEIDNLNAKINNLISQVNALDAESRKTKDDK